MNYKNVGTLLKREEEITEEIRKIKILKEKFLMKYLTNNPIVVPLDDLNNKFVYRFKNNGSTYIFSGITYDKKCYELYFLVHGIYDFNSEITEKKYKKCEYFLSCNLNDDFVNSILDILVEYGLITNEQIINFKK